MNNDMNNGGMNQQNPQNQFQQNQPQQSFYGQQNGMNIPGPPNNGGGYDQQQQQYDPQQQQQYDPQQQQQNEMGFIQQGMQAMGMEPQQQQNNVYNNQYGQHPENASGLYNEAPDLKQEEESSSEYSTDSDN